MRVSDRNRKKDRFLRISDAYLRIEIAISLLCDANTDEMFVALVSRVTIK